MQALAVSFDQYVDYHNQLKQTHRPDAGVFGGSKEWGVTISNHAERDQSDDAKPTYILATFGGQKVVGCARLQPGPLKMFADIIKLSMTNCYGQIVTATDLRFERILSRAGWPMRRLGEPCTIGNTRAIAGSLPADETSFRRFCPPGYRSSFGSIRTSALRSAA